MTTAGRDGRSGADAGTGRWRRCTPDDPATDWLLARGERHLAAGRIDEAIPFLDRAARLCRDVTLRVDVLEVLGDLFREQEDFARSTRCFREAAEQDPRRPSLLLRLGLAHAREENHRAAAVALRRAHAGAPEDPEILRALGVTLSALGDDAEAGAMLRRALAAVPDDLRVLESAAAHHLKMGRFATSAEILERVRRVDPENRLVKRLSKEASYLVERSSNPAEEAAEQPRPHLLPALTGRAGEVEDLLLGRLREDGFTDEQLLSARQVWRDYLRRRRPRVRRPAVLAAALQHAIARLDFVDGCARDDIALRYAVDDTAVRKAYEDVVATLDLEVLDPRYSTQPHPIEQVGLAEDADRDEIVRALLADEYREYEEAHAERAPGAPRLQVDEFEDASIEYGSLLTQELMGLTLCRRDRVRKRELERLLLVT